MSSNTLDLTQVHLQDKSEVSVEDLKAFCPAAEEDLDKVLEMYKEIQKLCQAAEPNSKKIAKAFRDVWEEHIEEEKSAQWQEREGSGASCYAILIHDLEVKMKGTKEALLAGGSFKFGGVWEETYDKVENMYLRFEEQGLVSEATKAVLKQLGRWPEAEEEEGNVWHAAMERLLLLLESQSPAKKVSYVLEQVRPQYEKMMQRATKLERMEQSGMEEPSPMDSKLMQEETLKQVEICYIKALHVAAKEVLCCKDLESLSQKLFGDEVTSAEVNTKMRRLSVLFHPDKMYFDDETLHEAGVENRASITDAQKRLMEAKDALSKRLAGLGEAEGLLRKAEQKFTKARELKKQADAAAREQHESSAYQHMVKLVLLAMDEWRSALRSMTPLVAVRRKQLIEVRTTMARACEMAGLKLECQVYLLSAMRLTAKAASTTILSPKDGQHGLDSWKSLWLEQRTILRSLSESFEQQHPKSAKRSSSAVTTLAVTLQNNMETLEDIHELFKASSSFDPKGALVLGAAFEELTAGALSKQKDEIDMKMKSVANGTARQILAASVHPATVVAPVVISALALAEVACPASNAATATVEAVGLAVGLVARAAFAVPFVLGSLAAGLFFLAGNYFGWRRTFREVTTDLSEQELRQKVVLSVMTGAEKKLRSGSPSAGRKFVEALSRDLSELDPDLFSTGTRILQYPSKNFAYTNELIADVGETIRYLTKDLEVCAAGVLQYLIYVAEVLAGGQVDQIPGGHSVPRDACLKAAKLLMRELLQACGGTDDRYANDHSNLELDKHADGALLAQARKEDESNRQLREFETVMDGIIRIKPGTEVETVRGFLSQGWFTLRTTRNVPSCETIEVKGQVKEGQVVQVMAKKEDGRQEKLLPHLSAIEHAMEWMQFDVLEIRVEPGLAKHISTFWNIQFSFLGSEEKGEKEKQVISLRTLLKANLAMVFLIETPIIPNVGLSTQTAQETMAEWLLQEVIKNVKEESSADEKLTEKVEALKDFFLVFVGRPLELEDGR